MVSDTTKASSASELLELPNTMPLMPKCVWYTPTRAVTAARKSRRQMVQFIAVHAPQQEQFFIGKRVRDAVSVGVFVFVHNDRKPVFLFT